MNITADQFPLLDHISSGILAIDADANIVLWNRQMERWCNVMRDQTIGQSLFEAFPEVAADAFKVRILQVLQGGAPVIFSPQLHHHLIACTLPDGAFRAQLVTITWLKTHQIALFTIEDQSEQFKLIEQHKNAAAQMQRELNRRKQLEAEKLQLATAIDQAGEAVIITNRQRQIKYANKACLLQTGWDLDEIKAMPQYDALLFDTDHSFEQQLESAASSGHPWLGRCNIRCKNGNVFTASISIAPIFDADNQLTNFIIIQEDISQQIHMEEKIRNTQKQEALITLVGGIAHDFNNLLAGLVGQVYLASREVADRPKTKDRLKKIQGIAHEASSIVSQLLTFARQGEHDAKEFPLNSFIKEFIKLARLSVPEDIALIPDFDNSTYAFRGDANLLQQALMNMVQNSAEACKGKANARIEIGLSIFDSDQHPQLLQKYPVLRHGNFAHLLIRDNGHGIPEEIQDRIFDPFFTTKQLGSGLGMAMVMGCIRNHHGIINIASSPETGTAIHLFLPLLTPREMPVMHDAPMDNTSAYLLLVDDDERVREPTKELLECMGHHVSLAKDGLDAVAIFEQQINAWDIVITDMVMPKMNGFEAAQRIRQLRPDIPIIFATGYDPSLVNEDARHLPNSKLIGKPFDPDELDHIITTMVGKE